MGHGCHDCGSPNGCECPSKAERTAAHQVATAISSLPSSNPYAGEEESAPADQMALLGRLVDQQVAAEKRVEELELELKEAQGSLRKLKEHDVPELMLQCGVKAIHTLSGASVKLKEVVRATFPKDPDKKQVAFDWLKSKGHDGLVKHQFIISFSKDQEKWAQKFERDLAKRKDPVALVRKDDIHNGTLCAFLREQLGEGAEVPLAAFGAFVQKFAEVDRDD